LQSKAPSSSKRGKKMKRIALLGSTGSIGVNALNVIREHREEYEIIALGAGTKIDLLMEQIEEFRPRAVCLSNEKFAERLRELTPPGKEMEILAGTEGLVEIATAHDVDTVISAITGAVCLLPTFEAIKAGKDIALANKETIVMAGGLIMGEAEKRGISLVPIDSEHSAVLQCLQGHEKGDLRGIILTASGGPFRTTSLEEIKKATPGQALDHPNWSMGPKISIDSATMMNKGLEAIEARWLFDLEMDRIRIMIHPQSIVHSMVEYRDGSVIAHMGIPDMRIPIAYALSYPRHLENRLPRLELDRIGTLSFEKPDMKRFRCLALALEAARVGESMQAVLNGANEIAVESFLNRQIGFLDIARVIEKTMEAHVPFKIRDVGSVLETDHWARKKAAELIKKINK
jgi:1-deoxy-D-xylulose-5-phosphate reductoisomerase